MIDRIGIFFKHIQTPNLHAAFILFEYGNPNLILHVTNSIYLKALGKHYWFPKYLTIPLKNTSNKGNIVLLGWGRKLIVEIDTLPQKQITQQAPNILIEQNIKPVQSNLANVQVPEALLNQCFFDGLHEKAKNPKFKAMAAPNFNIIFNQK
jgi:hypothetical protein